MAGAHHALVGVVARVKEVVDEKPVRVGLHHGVVDVGLRAALERLVPVVVAAPVAVEIKPRQVVGLRLEPRLLCHEGGVMFNQRTVAVAQAAFAREVGCLLRLQRRRVAVDLHRCRGGLAVEGRFDRVLARAVGGREKDGVLQHVARLGPAEDECSQPGALRRVERLALFALVTERLREPTGV